MDTQMDTAIFDVDGTLVDTNYQHALAWFRAFRRYDITVPVWRIHRATGMGGDHLVSAVTDEETELRHGDDLRAAWGEEFDSMIAEVVPFEGARELLQEVRDRGFRLVLASSGQQEHVDHYLDLLDARDLAQAWTTSADVDETKPDPDLVHVALEKVGGTRGVMVGDSTWDFVAAQRAGVSSLAVRTGGFSVEELREAGAERVFDSLVELRESLDDTKLARASG
jgi:HAD superfamily hydrolase (TIGR01549 family)